MRLVRCIFLLMVLALMPAAVPATGTVIGVVLSSDLPRYREAHRHLLKVLSAKGYTASSEILLQTPNPDPQSWSNAVRKLAAYRAGLIVAYGAPAVATAVQEGGGIPVLAVDAVLPEGIPVQGLCGISSRVPMVTLQRVLQESRHPRAVGVLYSSRDVGSLRQLEELRRAARQGGYTLQEGNVASAAALDKTLAALLERCDALIVTEGGLISRQFERIVARARQARVPVATTMPDGAERGALVALEVSPAEQGEVAGRMAVRLLEGARPEQVGVESPRRVELVVNLRVAKSLDIAVPFQVLGMATRVIK